MKNIIMIPFCVKCKLWVIYVVSHFLGSSNLCFDDSLPFLLQSREEFCEYTYLCATLEKLFDSKKNMQL